MLWIVEQISKWSLPVILVFFPLYGMVKGVDVYAAFVEGAEEGFWTCLKVMPYLLGMFLAIGVLRSSGALDAAIGWMAPLTRILRIHPDVVPLMLLRPLSGSGALAVTAEVLRAHGPDSFVGRLASCLQGSTDTTLYVISVYFGSVGIRRHRRVLLTALLADMCAYVASFAACSLMWGK